MHKNKNSQQFIQSDADGKQSETKLKQVHILGCGTSTGVPILGCKCKICQSGSVKNQRLRSSILLTNSLGKNVVVDTTPDFRTQFLRSKIDQLAAAIITHAHADHIHGVDDLRAFFWVNQKDFPLYASEETLTELKEKFPYIFNREKHFAGKKILGGGIPMVETHQVFESKQVMIEGMKFEFFFLPHGHIKTTCFICDDFAYFIDIKSIPKTVLEYLKSKKLKLLLLDCNSIKPHSTHLHLEKSLEYAQFIGAKATRFVHLSHHFDFDELNSQLPENIRAAYDQETLLL